MPRKAGRKIPYSFQHRRTTGFYEDKLSLDEQTARCHARDIEGIEEEIALLRVRVRSLAEDPRKTPYFLKSMDILVRALDATRRLNKQSSKNDLMEAVSAVLENVGGAAFSGPPPAKSPTEPH